MWRLYLLLYLIFLAAGLSTKVIWWWVLTVE